MPPLDPWKELRDVVRFEDPEQLALHLERLAGPLGLQPSQVAHLTELSAEQLASQLRALLKEHQAEGRAARARVVERLALQAAEELQDSATIINGAVHLEIGVLLGDLLRHPTAKFIGLELPGTEPIYVAKKKLRSVAKTLRSFDDVTACLDGDGLHFRWKGGNGGLNLHSRSLSWNDRQRVLSVPIVGHQQPRAQRPPLRRRQSGGWLGDILTDIGLVP